MHGRKGDAKPLIKYVHQKSGNNDKNDKKRLSKEKISLTWQFIKTITTTTDILLPLLKAKN